MEPEIPNASPEQIKKNDKKEKEKKNKQSRSVETMFRSTLGNLIQLSKMADEKAGLLMSVNAIILSIMTSFFVREMGAIPYLMIPICLLVVVCLFTITFALLATRPALKPHGSKPTDEEILKIDLLFFSEFTTLSLDEYQTAMKDMMKNDKILQKSIINNIYAQGKAMQRKYSLIKIAYTIFMIGFPAAIIGFLVTLWINE